MQQSVKVEWGYRKVRSTIEMYRSVYGFMPGNGSGITGSGVTGEDLA